MDTIHSAFLIFIFSISLTASSYAQSHGLQKSIEQEITSEWLDHSTVGILAVKSGGDTLVSFNSMKMLIPASTMKTVTTGAALHSLGPDYRFSTSIGYSGNISDGILHGDIYISGGGDPTLGSRNPVAIPVEKTFIEWRKILKDAGIEKINGHIIGDARFFDETAEIDSWQWNDIGTYYGCGTSGLSFNENMQSINFTPGKAPGEPLAVKTGYPELPWMEYRFLCSTGAAGSGNTLYLFTSPFSTYGEMRGTLAIDRPVRTEKVSNKFPAYTCAWHFCRYLEKCGVHVSMGAASTERIFTPSEGIAENTSIIPLGVTFSPGLCNIASETNHESNNMYAETLFKTLGKEYCGKGTYIAAEEALKGILNEIGAKPDNRIVISDGSGLSRQNSMSPEFMCRFLQAMMDSPVFPDYIGTLPHPGGKGTLMSMMRGTTENIRSRFRLKSGSMSGVQCYCGYIIPSEGCKEETITVSIMVNNYYGSSSRLQKFIEKILLSLSMEN